MAIRRITATLAVAAGLAVLAGCGEGTSSGASSSTPKSPTTPAPAASTTASSGTAPRTTTATHGTSTPASTPERAPDTERVLISSPVVPHAEAPLPARYTCDGQNTPPPLRWKGIPKGTAELMLDIIKIAPVNHKLYFAWAVAGLSPKTHGINQGQLPAGGIVGTNSAGQRGYDLCPPKGSSEGYVAVLFALPHRLAAQPGFDAAALRREAERTATYQGFLIFTYQRH
jgi:phosphatidylethanolamine-binding protein (PEBP) family uncharacterized protein